MSIHHLSHELIHFLLVQASLSAYLILAANSIKTKICLPFLHALECLKHIFNLVTLSLIIKSYQHCLYILVVISLYETPLESDSYFGYNYWEGSISLQGVEAKNAAKHPIAHRSTPWIIYPQMSRVLRLRNFLWKDVQGGNFNCLCEGEMGSWSRRGPKTKTMTLKYMINL